MKKRRTNKKLKKMVILALLVIGSVVLLTNCQKQEDEPKTSECVVSASEEVTNDDFFLDIPLEDDLQIQLYEASQEFNVDYYIMIALIERETHFRNVLGDGGNSYGYCQIQPKWWYGLMLEIGATDLTIPKDNFRTACAIMARLTAQYKSTEGALVAYNQGYYNGKSTQYSRDIIANADRYRA